MRREAPLGIDGIVVEERISGVERTVCALTDGREVEVMGHGLNHPRLLAGDTGPPSGGTGQVSPAPPLTGAPVATDRSRRRG